MQSAGDDQRIEGRRKLLTFARTVACFVSRAELVRRVHGAAPASGVTDEREIAAIVEIARSRAPDV